ncbi:MAG: hypothetical protein U0794_13740 [Isosphaeraceae bacterium]
MDRFTIDGDLGASRVDLGSQLANDLAVDRDPSLENQLLAGATRPDAGVRQDLLKPILSRGRSASGRAGRIGASTRCLGFRGPLCRPGRPTRRAIARTRSVSLGALPV